MRFFPPFPPPHHHPFLSLTKKNLQRLNAKGVLWKPPEMEDSSSSSPSSSDLRSVVFRLSHGGEVSSDGNCLFTASRKAMGCEEMDPKELRRRTVARFLEDFGSVSFEERDAICEFRICGVFKKLLPLVPKVCFRKNK